MIAASPNRAVENRPSELLSVYFATRRRPSVKMIPILPSGDFEATERFYQPLGFVTTGRWANEYLILQRSREGLELHFWSNRTLIQ